MVGAHSRPPNHTGDHGHQQEKQDETITPTFASPYPSGRTHNRKCSPQPATLPQNNKPVVLHSHGLPSNKPATQGRAQLPDRLLMSTSKAQSSHTCLFLYRDRTC
ncbi:hypothetical protein E2C01_096298 [Portunus trituberculatus]|uniref:Uncharacterized protein n=1 Tax=Portunus trituberculatus TaxID=210409 RepID=A0A5B7K669_PORTR|nr:hypothetical protein [Portunus trituberculatus]